jgi:hypothetical protein
MAHLHYLSVGLYPNACYTPVSVTPQLFTRIDAVSGLTSHADPHLAVPVHTFVYNGVKHDVGLNGMQMILRPMSHLTQVHVDTLCNIVCPNTPARYWSARPFGNVEWWREHGMAESADGAAMGISPAADFFLRLQGFDRGGYIVNDGGQPVWVNSLINSGAAVLWGGGV